MIDWTKARGLPAYELAQSLEFVPMSNADIARELGRSRTFVSRLRQTWRGACPSLRAAWESGEIAYDVVKLIATVRDDREQSFVVQTYLKQTRGRTRAARAEARVALERKRTDKC